MHYKPIILSSSVFLFGGFYLNKINKQQNLLIKKQKN